MPARGWLAYFRPQPGAELPGALRIGVAASSGAALSLSFIGSYLSIYSLVCVGVLLVVLFGARPRVAFCCGFLTLCCLCSLRFRGLPQFLLSTEVSLARAAGAYCF